VTQRLEAQVFITNEEGDLIEGSDPSNSDVQYEHFSPTKRFM
jgi:hypothetical protein